jgi:hypothetical protein
MTKPAMPTPTVNDVAVVLHLLAKYDYVARRPRYPAFAWRVLSSRFRRLAAACDDAVLAEIAADCWMRAELPEWRDARRRRWTWGFAPLMVCAIVVTPAATHAAPAGSTAFN